MEASWCQPRSEQVQAELLGVVKGSRTRTGNGQSQVSPALQASVMVRRLRAGAGPRSCLNRDCELHVIDRWPAQARLRPDVDGAEAILLALPYRRVCRFEACDRVLQAIIKAHGIC